MLKINLRPGFSLETECSLDFTATRIINLCALQNDIFSFFDENAKKKLLKFIQELALKVSAYFSKTLWPFDSSVKRKHYLVELDNIL